MLDVSMADAAKRFSLVNADLATAQRACVTAGLAELEADDALEDLSRVQTRPCIENASGCDQPRLTARHAQRPRDSA